MTGRFLRAALSGVLAGTLEAVVLIALKRYIKNLDAGVDVSIETPTEGKKENS